MEYSAGSIAMKFCVRRACLSGTCEPVYFAAVVGKKPAAVTAFNGVWIAAGLVWFSLSVQQLQWTDGGDLAEKKTLGYAQWPRLEATEVTLFMIKVVHAFSFYS